MLHQPSFNAEVEKFYEMVESGRKYEVDPAWLAMFYLVRLLFPPSERYRLPREQVIALASDDSLHMSFSSPLSVDEDWVVKGRTLQGAAQRLMYLADCMGRPQVRIIQSVSFVSFLQRPVCLFHVVDSQMHSSTRMRT
jgi:hypothetical protein